MVDFRLFWGVVLKLLFSDVQCPCFLFLQQLTGILEWVMGEVQPYSLLTTVESLDPLCSPPFKPWLGSSPIGL